MYCSVCGVYVSKVFGIRAGEGGEVETRNNYTIRQIEIKVVKV